MPSDSAKNVQIRLRSLDLSLKVWESVQWDMCNLIGWIPRYFFFLRYLSCAMSCASLLALTRSFRNHGPGRVRSHDGVRASGCVAVKVGVTLVHSIDILPDLFSASAHRSI